MEMAARRTSAPKVAKVRFPVEGSPTRGLFKEPGLGVRDVSRKRGAMGAHSPIRDREVAYRRLIELGIALSAERNHSRLLEKILLGAKELTNADGGTLYLVSEGGSELRFVIMRNDSMGIALGGTTGAPIPFPPVPLLEPD